MSINNRIWREFDRTNLQLPKSICKKYTKQVSFLTQELQSRLEEETDLRISKFEISGSFAKHTNIQKSPLDKVDVDVVMFVKQIGFTEQDLEHQIELTYQTLTELYESKSIKDFKQSKSAATVFFHKSGLSVDVVPVIEDPSNRIMGLQYKKFNRQWIRTCPSGQVEFIRNMQNRDKDFRLLVRLAKKWRNHVKLHQLSSYMIELIIANILNTISKFERIDEKFQHFFLYIVQSELGERISPDTGISPMKFLSYDLNTFHFSNRLQQNTVVIEDPFCRDNNIAGNLSNGEKEDILDAAYDGWVMANYASATGDQAIWSDEFGFNFKNVIKQSKSKPTSKSTANSDFDQVFQYLVADFNMMFQTSGAKNIKDLPTILDDIRILASHGILKKVAATLVKGGNTVAATSFHFKRTVRQGYHSDLQGVMWPRAYNSFIKVMATKTSKCADTTFEKIEPQLKLNWDTKLYEDYQIQLKERGHCAYNSQGFAINRVDYIGKHNLVVPNNAHDAIKLLLKDSPIADPLLSIKMNTAPAVVGFATLDKRYQSFELGW